MSHRRVQRSPTGHVLLPASNNSNPDSTKPLLIPRNVFSWTFGRGTVVWTIWPAVLLHIVFAVVVTSISLASKVSLAVPQVMITVLGVVIGFVISYRAMSGYDRYWAGRTSWGDIIKTSRALTRLIWIHVPLKSDKSSSSEDKVQVEKLLREKRQALDLVEAFAVAVKHHLRGETGIYYEDLYHLVKPLHNHSHSPHIQKPLPARPDQSSPQVVNTAVNVSSPESPLATTHYVPTLPRDSATPAVNEYGTFHSESCYKYDSSENPTLFSSTPRHSYGPRILYELVPFSSLFVMLDSSLRQSRNQPAHFFPHPDDEDSEEKEELGRWYAGPCGRKFRPIVPGKGRNVPLEILYCLSEWLAELEGRGTVPASPLGGMYLCLTALGDSLTAVEQILTTPLPFVYAAHIRQCVWLYLFLLPFQLIDQFGWYTIPGVCVAAFFYIGFLAAGEEIEQPFGYDENDLNLDLFCHHIIHEEIEALKRRDCKNSHIPSSLNNSDGQ